MNALIENKDIKEMECGSNFAYVLSDNSTFLSTEYKVLQSQANSCFVKCMKMMYNGKVQLYYFTQGLKSFASMIPTLDTERFLTIVSNLFADILDVKHNGFLSCQNIDISFDRIYVDPTTYKVSLVYLPLSKRLYDDPFGPENEIRTGLVKLIAGVSALSSPQAIQFSADLSNGTVSIEDLYARIKGGKMAPSAPVREEPVVKAEPASEPVPEAISTAIPAAAPAVMPAIPVAPAATATALPLCLIAMNAPVRVVINVNKDAFVIGKKAELCDGIIGFNQMISRSHCRINRVGGRYTVTDLQSANGTYVNKVKLQPNVPHPIQNGDVVRMANSDFRVSIG